MVDIKLRGNINQDVYRMKNLTQFNNKKFHNTLTWTT